MIIVNQFHLEIIVLIVNSRETRFIEANFI